MKLCWEVIVLFVFFATCGWHLHVRARWWSGSIVGNDGWRTVIEPGHMSAGDSQRRGFLKEVAVIRERFPESFSESIYKYPFFCFPHVNQQRFVFNLHLIACEIFRWPWIHIWSIFLTNTDAIKNWLDWDTIMTKLYTFRLRIS